MNKIATYVLTCLLLTPSAVLAQSKRPTKPAKPAEERPKPAAPKPYENAENKFRFELPETWQSAPGGCPGSIYNLLIPPDLASLPKPKSGETRRIYGDLFTLAVNPAPAGAETDLAAAVAEIQAQVTKNEPAAEFKPLEKAKVAGVDASVLTATMSGRHDDEPKRVHRHLVFLRDGKVFQIILYAHANTIARQTAAVQKIVKSFEWTDQPARSSPTAARKATATVFKNAEHGLELQVAPGWEVGELSLAGSVGIAVFSPPETTPGHNEDVTLFQRDPKGQDADGVLTALQGEIRSHDANAQFDPIEDATLGGERARVFSYRLKLDAAERSGMMLAGIHDGKAYIVKYSADPAGYEKHREVVKKMINSLRWTKQAIRTTTKPAA